METNQFFESYLAHLNEAAEILERDESLDPALRGWVKKAHEELKAPKRIAHKTLQVEMDDGRTESFEAWRVLYNNALGPGKGGIRFDPAVDEPTVIALAAEMTVKTSLMGLPLGGGKGGVRVNSKKLSKGERERLDRAYVRAFRDVLGWKVDVPAPDVGTGPEDMDTMADEFGDPRVFTGKSIKNGGSEGRGTATAQGMIYAGKEAALKIGWGGLEGKTVAIQGYGNAGKNAAIILHDEDCIIAAVNDRTGGALDMSGLNPREVSQHKRNTGSVKGYADSKDITSDELLILDVDIVIPAALENQITETNAYRVKAKMIWEAANGPVNAKADKILHDKGILGMPDILGNGGGVTVSYWEMKQNDENEHWSAADVDKKLEGHMTSIFNDVYKTSNRYNVDMRTAAYTVALKRIATEMMNNVLDCGI